MAALWYDDGMSDALKVVGLGLVLLTSCATTSTEAQLKNLSTGSVPCSEQEIKVVDKSGAQGMNRWTWTVECDGTVYFCAKESYTPAICRAKQPKPTDAPAGAPAPAASAI